MVLNPDLNGKINDFSGSHKRLGLEYFVFISYRFIEVNLKYREMYIWVDMVVCSWNPRDVDA